MVFLFCICGTVKLNGQVCTVLTFHSILIQFFISFTVLNAILIKLSNGNKKPTDIEMTFSFDIRLMCLLNGIFVERALKSDGKSYHVTTSSVILKTLLDCYTFVIRKRSKNYGFDEFFYTDWTSISHW